QDTLEQVIWIQNTVAASFDDLNLIIQTFHKPTCLTMNKVIQYLLHPLLQCRQKCIETPKSTLLDTIDPRMDFPLCSTPLPILIRIDTSNRQGLANQR